MIKILFVCLGNICRSPAAEAIMNDIVEKHGKKNNILCDSAGTAAYHIGEHADNRMRKSALERGVTIRHKGRQITKEDLANFTYIIAMDDSNYFDILSLDKEGKYKNKVHRFVEFCHDAQSGSGYFSKNPKEVPDPYYMGEDGFHLVLDILDEGCNHLFHKIILEDKKGLG